MHKLILTIDEVINFHIEGLREDSEHVPPTIKYCCVRGGDVLCYSVWTRKHKPSQHYTLPVQSS